MSMDCVSPCVTRPPPESAEAPGKRLKSEPKTPLESKRVEDMDESGFRRMYDDISEPFYYACDRFVYRNKAQIRLDEEIEKAMAVYSERSKNLSIFDAIAPPAIAHLCGGVRPLTITDDIRPLLIRLCNLALDKYNAETENQGANFVFEDLVKSTYRCVSGPSVEEATRRGAACGQVLFHEAAYLTHAPWSRALFSVVSAVFFLAAVALIFWVAGLIFAVQEIVSIASTRSETGFGCQKHGGGESVDIHLGVDSS